MYFCDVNVETLPGLRSKNHFRNYSIFYWVYLFSSKCCFSFHLSLLISFFIFPYVYLLHSNNFFLSLYLLSSLPPSSLSPSCNCLKCPSGLWSSLIAISKEVIKEQLPARNLSAAVRRVLQGTNVANHRPPFWSGRKSTNLAVRHRLRPE